MFDIIVQRYEKILLKTCSDKNRECIRFLDFGGGTGILSLLAKKCGISYVAYHDISREYSENFKILADLLNIPIDSICQGSYLTISQNEFFDVIANYDVLEHLDRPLFALIELKKYLRPNGIIYMVSGANTYNPLLNIMNKIKHFEYEPLNKKNHLFEKRRSYIKSHYPQLSNALIDLIAIHTRGLTYENIEAYIKLFMISGFSIKTGIGSNTCNPDTGYWQENCFNFFRLCDCLKTEYYFVQLVPLTFPISKPRLEIPYNHKSKVLLIYYPVLRFLSLCLAPILNFLIHMLPLRTKFLLAPSYGLFLQRD